MVLIYPVELEDEIVDAESTDKPWSQISRGAINCMEHFLVVRQEAAIELIELCAIPG